MAEAAASAVAVEAYKDGRGLIFYVKQKYVCFRNINKNYIKLKEEAEKLYARRNDVEYEIQRNNRMKATNECRVWINKVEKIKKELDDLETKFQIKRKHIWRFQSSRLNMSRCMEKKCHEVKNLWEEGKLENGIIVESLPQRAQMMHAPKIKDKPSLHGVVEEVLDFLKDNDTRRIGIWGMPGIGKTTIMQNLNNNEDITKLFDIVIWVTVSKERCMENVQQAVLERLKLNVESIISTDEVASKILEELKSKKYLLLWMKFGTPLI
ncbi:hypothetical protein HHK36_030324 [Tetracentron sinense]|uniref:NB-ARC domain-containing protein n=1 Tax=Tetracentron sinense TaxID=13715 RepID=A0A834Y979_TETSI|nr:hypothetical protein HHK36_030324 [Tetracentron sinense]